MVDGAARDSALIRELPLPYFVRSVTPVAGSTGDAYGACQGTVTVGGASVSPGDVVFGDADGVLVGSIEAFEAVVDKAEAVAAVEDALSESSPPLSASCLHAKPKYSSSVYLPSDLSCQTKGATTECAHLLLRRG